MTLVQSLANLIEDFLTQDQIFFLQQLLVAFEF